MVAKLAPGGPCRAADIGSKERVYHNNLVRKLALIRNLYD
jgi:hypothetical protein